MVHTSNCSFIQWTTHIFIQLPIHPLVHTSIHLTVYSMPPHIHSSNFPSNGSHIHSSNCSFIQWSTHPFIQLSIHLVCTYIHPTVHPSCKSIVFPFSLLSFNLFIQLFIDPTKCLYYTSCPSIHPFFNPSIH